jgi:glycosyltransferase involved in cell wall biosynthesis
MSELANFFSAKPDTYVSLISLTKQGKIFYDISTLVSIYMPGFEFRNSARLLSTLKTFSFLRQTIKDIKPDTVLSFGETYNSFVILSSLFLKVKIFISDRSRPDKSWGFFHEVLRRVLYPLASGIISQTNYSKEFLLKETANKNIVVIPNPIRLIENKALGRENIILNVGRLIKSKRIDLLLRIFSECKNDEWMLWLVGEDENAEKEKLLELTGKLNIDHKVIFWNKQDNIDRFYNVAKIFAFTSESEGMPNVLLEAMVAGLACISFDCKAGPGDIINDGENGFLVKMYDCEDYVYKLNSLIMDSELRNKFSQNAQKKREEHNIEIIGEKFYKFLLS